MLRFHNRIENHILIYCGMDYLGHLKRILSFARQKYYPSQTDE